MRLNVDFIFNQIVKITLISGVISFSTIMPTLAETVKVPAHIEDKLYRKALYFYFTGNYGEALNQISLNSQRFNSHSSRSRLFEAGIQVTLGLDKIATESLRALQKNQIAADETGSVVDNTENSQSSTSPAELMLIALLELAEQQIQQGDTKTAKQTLSQITEVSSSYSDQYQILTQLAYWPEVSPQSVAHSAENSDEKSSSQQSSSSAYIKLNKALLYMEQGDFELAEPILTKIKNTLWLPPSKTFWQLLFNPLSDDNKRNLSEKVNDERIQQQAVNDYAQLLLAQMYVKKERYEAAYYELKNFPQDSPYTESALFIFAFSAQKIKQYTMSLKLFDVVAERYPYSNLGWQSSLLLAGQVVDQMSLGEGMTSYQNAERLFQQRLRELADFHQGFLLSDDLLTFSPKKKKLVFPEVKTDVATESMIPFFTNSTYSTDSVWLQKALFDNQLQADFQTLVELDLLTKHLKGQQQKNQWLKDTLVLNSKRKAKLAEMQQQTNYRSIIEQLKEQQQKISKIVTDSESKQQGHVFANQTEEQWLERIQASKQVVSSIKDNKNIDEYQKRIKRIEGVLTWQLHQSFPERLWQHKKQLKEIDQLLVIAEQHRSRFVALTGSASLLSDLAGRIQTSATDIKKQLNNVVELRVKTSKEIQVKVKRFVENQRVVLEGHLLASRHEMAAVLESMAKLDKRIERQLVPSTNKSKELNTNDANSNIIKPNLAANLQFKDAL
jgi:Tfp pilus assembly protein PilF